MRIILRASYYNITTVVKDLGGTGIMKSSGLVDGCSNQI